MTVTRSNRYPVVNSCEQKIFFIQLIFLFILYSGDSTIVYNNSDLAQTRLYWSFYHLFFFCTCQIE